MFTEDIKESRCTNSLPHTEHVYPCGGRQYKCLGKEPYSYSTKMELTK